MFLAKLILAPFVVWAVFYPLDSEETAVCQSWAGKVIFFQGTVEEQRFQKLGWQPIHLNAHYCPGDRIRTLNAGQAYILLPDDTYFQINAWTTVTFLKNKQVRKTWYNCFRNLIEFLQCNPFESKGDTLFINAAFVGTFWLPRLKAKKRLI
jgi:hypothetical protein